jgi:hypothetical protein
MNVRPTAVIGRADIARDLRGGTAQFMRFSESDLQFPGVPPWAEFLIAFGLRWGQGVAGSRRVAIVSMPCDSAGAALVALGALRFRLGLADANQLDGHFQRIQRAADAQTGDVFLRHNLDRGRFLLRGRRNDGTVYVEQYPSPKGGPLRKPILPELAASWTFDGEAPIQVLQGREIPHRAFYDAITDAPPIVPANLHRSDSGLCLAGRVTGETASRNTATEVRFHIGTATADLTELLTVHAWSPGMVSRTLFFNSRTRQFDRGAGATRLVVADGDQAFLKAVGAPPFQHSDVIGVIHRAVERERLEALAIKMGELRQWYDVDADSMNRLPAPPRAVTYSVLRRK